jgi:hypothetical protein
MSSWLESTNHEVRESAEALEAVLAKYGVLMIFEDLLFSSLSLINLDAERAGSLGNMGKSTERVIETTSEV